MVGQRVLAEKANISESTINKIVQGISGRIATKSLSVKLARHSGVSVDELIGAKTISDETRKVIAMTRVLDEHHRKVIRIYAKHQYILHKNNNSPKQNNFCSNSKMYRKKIKTCISFR